MQVDQRKVGDWNLRYFRNAFFLVFWRVEGGHLNVDGGSI